MSVQLFQWLMPEPPLLLRRTETSAGITDEAFIGGVWQPTRVVVDYMFGHNDFVDPIDEAEAKALAPDAL